MVEETAKPRMGTLWQWPMLMVSVGLMGGAAYLYIGTIPKPRWDQQAENARQLVAARQPEAAIDYLNRVLASRKLPEVQEAEAHLLLAEALDVAQRQANLSHPDNHARIIQQSNLALAGGVPPTVEIHHRIARAYLALSRPNDALEHYRKAAGLEDTPETVRAVLDLEFATNQQTEAAKTLERYLELELKPADGAWALGQRAQMLMEEKQYEKARESLNEAMGLTEDREVKGELRYYLGLADFRLNDIQAAESNLQEARTLLGIRNSLDGEAAVLLGQIQQSRGDYPGAMALYQETLTSHITDPAAMAARLGRGVCRILMNQDHAGLEDLELAVKQLTTRQGGAKYRGESARMLQVAEKQLAGNGNFQGALEVMAHEDHLDDQPPAAFFARLASLYERRSEQVEKMLGAAPERDKDKRAEQVRQLRSRAGDAYIAYSRALTVADDKGYGEALWRGIDLYDRAGDIARAIAALETFTLERPEDPLAPDATLRLGRSYLAAGRFDKAIATFQRNQLRYSKSLAASKSAIPLAQAYIAKGPEAYGSAERVLLAVVENNALIAPEAEEFREAIVELGQLYYRTNRYEEAVARFDEWAQRYKTERRLGQVLFLMADSLRKSATLLKTSTTRPVMEAEAAKARRERLERAHSLYDRVAEFYRDHLPEGETEKLYARLALYYRADCLYDLERYEEAIRAYDLAAFKQQDDPSSLAAYVQIVNAYCALGKYEDARAANERARWMLRRMPPEAFSSISFILPRQYWEQWMQWSNGSGLWKQESAQ